MLPKKRAPDFANLEGSGSAPDFLTLQAEAAASPSVRKLDRCRACGGSGQFRSRYTGRIVGDCFRCKGTGSVSRGTNERVEKSRVTRTETARRRASEAEAFRAAHPDVAAWISSRTPRVKFAADLHAKLTQYGSLTVGQIEAVRRIIADDADRAAEHAKRLAASEPQGSGLDLSKLPEGRYAVPGGDTRLKVLVQRPVPPSRWSGFIFVSDAAEYGSRRKYGRQAPGKTYSGDIVPELRAILADPRAALAAYGHLTGTCGVCGRHLEDAESIARGIGPICAGKLGY